ncbi:glutathione S-transferase family protein [Halomonas sp. HAL1]|uniref:glutathione S-transferase family protein n=1 Tax=Halomonas sp. HAL1 TaxID=550984 RepID=UPI00022D31C6|nr:glutathione S-transferase family protein [Halomonas sp. HAL1]EHA16473.1 glutathione S-transferase domain-containing protein [Halomonas sp. HAL1]WKV92697.1 glutathione S-transferase family protein [Halomonas sp. HAL1]
MKLKIFYSSASPFVRKVLVSAHEKNVFDQIEKLPSKAWPVKRDPNIVKENPSGKVPTALLDDDTPLFDSRVICAYIDTLSNSWSLYPENLKDRFSVMTLEALADSILDAALLCRYESVLRPQEYYWALWHDSQMEKIDSGLDDLENRWLKLLKGPASVGSIATACTLAYLDFRFPQKDWRSDHDLLASWFADFSKRPSMQATQPE